MKSYAAILAFPALLACAAAVNAEPQTRGTDESSSGRPPNVVLFLIDDLGYTDVGCYGSDFYETPNIDRLAREGMRFTDAYAACCVCSPTRVSVLTGKNPARLHITHAIFPTTSAPRTSSRPAAERDPRRRLEADRVPRKWPPGTVQS